MPSCSAFFRTERYQRLEEALLQESIRLENAAKEERAQIDQMLHTENLNTSDELRARISELKEAIDRHAEELKNFETRQKEARHARELGASAEQKLQELAAAQKHLAEKQAQEEDVRDFRVRWSVHNAPILSSTLNAKQYRQRS